MKAMIEKEKPKATDFLSTLSEKEVMALKLYIAAINPLNKNVYCSDFKVKPFTEFINQVVNAFSGMNMNEINPYIINERKAFEIIRGLDSKDRLIDLYDIGRNNWKKLSGGKDMSTRSYICKETEPGKYVGVYCHSDGYLTYNGAMLFDHYNEREKVDKLISLGDMSSLNENIDPNPEEPHTFDDRQPYVTVFYGRDRGEKGTEAKDIKLEDINNPDSWIEYCYVYGLDNKWKYFECGQLEEGLKDLEEGLNNEYRELGFSRPEGTYGYYTESDIEHFKDLEKQKNAEHEM